MSALSSLDDRLQRLSKSQLIGVVHEMIGRHPGLESLVDIVPDETTPIDPATIRRYVEQAFDDVEGYGAYDYGYSRTVRANLRPIRDLGHEQIEAENWEPASTVFRTVIEEIRQRYGSFRDEESEVVRAADNCADALGTVLGGTSDSALRDQILRTLYELYRWDAKEGGYGMASSVPEVLDKQTTPEERRRVATWLRDDVPSASEDRPPVDDLMSGSSGDRSPDRWLRRELGQLLLTLIEDVADDETYLARCRETGHVKKRAARLLELGRVEEAADAVSKLSDYAVSELLDRFVEVDAGAAARSIAQSRLGGDDPSRRIAEWLYEQATASGDSELALYASTQAFFARPKVRTVDRVRTAAQRTGEWTGLRDRLLEHLRDTSRYRTLARVLAHLGAVDEALQVVEDRLLANAHQSATHSALLDVAQAAGEARPEGAARIYDQLARGLIEDRGRKNYAEAASFMNRAKALFERKDRPGDWTALIDRLYDDELSGLPAARDEFEKASLL